MTKTKTSVKKNIKNVNSAKVITNTHPIADAIYLADSDKNIIVAHSVVNVVETLNKTSEEQHHSGCEEIAEDPVNIANAQCATDVKKEEHLDVTKEEHQDVKKEEQIVKEEQKNIQDVQSVADETKEEQSVADETKEEQCVADETKEEQCVESETKKEQCISIITDNVEVNPTTDSETTEINKLTESIKELKDDIITWKYIRDKFVKIATIAVVIFLIFILLYVSIKLTKKYNINTKWIMIIFFVCYYGFSIYQAFIKKNKST